MRIAPEDRLAYEEEILALIPGHFAAEAHEMLRRDRQDPTVELAGNYPRTLVLVTFRDGADGRRYGKVFPVWGNDDFGADENRDSAPETASLIVLNTYMPNEGSAQLPETLFPVDDRPGPTRRSTDDEPVVKLLEIHERRLHPSSRQRC